MIYINRYLYYSWVNTKAEGFINLSFPLFKIQQESESKIKTSESSVVRTFAFILTRTI